MSFIVVIPARYHSTRLPGKPLLEIGDRTMLEHVVERARASDAEEVIVATDSIRIRELCRLRSIPVCMTDETHQSGTDRIAEVCRQRDFHDELLVVNVQGDEPMIPPSVINQVAHNLEASPEAGICTLFEPMTEMTQVLDPNAVKVVTDDRGRALYFSRAPIPYPRDTEQEKGSLQAADPRAFKRHVGIYAYRARILQQFVGWPPSPLEQQEKLEQLRALEAGVIIQAVASCEAIPAGVDTPNDLNAIRQLLAEDS